MTSIFEVGDPQPVNDLPPRRLLPPLVIDAALDIAAWARAEAERIYAEVMVREVELVPDPESGARAAAWARAELDKILAASSLIAVSELFPEDKPRPTPFPRKIQPEPEEVA